MCMPIAALCCLSGMCSCCCCSIPCRGSSVTRLVYAILLLVVTILAWALRNWGDLIVPDRFQTCVGDCFNYLSVYRFSMGLVLFHAFMAIFTIGVTTSRFFRAKFHNGWWPAKLLIVGGLIAACFYIPDVFFRYYAYISIAGGVLFLLIQTILVLEFAHGTAETWVEHWEEERDICWQIMLIGSTVVSYSIVIAVTVVLYVYFAKGPYLGINVFFITFNLILVIVASVMSVLPAVQEANPRSGLLQSALLGAYSTYVVASSIASEPRGDSGDCAPTDDVFSQVLFYAGFALTFLALCISAFTATSSEGAFTGEGEEAVEDEKEGVAYPYWFLHVIFLLAGFYMAVLLNNWAIFDGEAAQQGTFCIDQGFGSVWAKAATSWLVSLFYIWSLVAPILFPDRNFGRGA